MRSKRGSTTSNIAFIGLILALCLAGYLGYELMQAGNAYAVGYKAARTSLAADCPFLTMPIHGMSGTVVSVSNGQLVVKENNLATDPQVDGVSDDRVVTIDASTVLSRMTQNASAQPTRSTNPAGIPLLPPSPYTITTIQLKDLKVGDTVQVQSTDDVRLEATIKASSVDDMSQ